MAIDRSDSSGGKRGILTTGQGRVSKSRQGVWVGRGRGWLVQGSIGGQDRKREEYERFPPNVL